MPSPFRRWMLIPAAMILAALAIAPSLAAPSSASAHPLGNFTINHYSRIDVSATGIEVFRVLDMAEIPTVQERPRIDTNGDGTLAPAETEAWATAKIDELREGMTLRINGDETALRPTTHTLAFPEATAGLSILRLEVTYAAALPDGWQDSTPRVEYEDTNYAGKLGWREIVVRAGPGVELIESSAPATDISSALTAYPENTLSSPLDLRSATATFKPGTGAPLPVIDTGAERAVRGNPDSSLDRFGELIAKDNLSFGVIAVSLIAAAGFGAVHALSPGHGKTIVAAYLVGSRGTAKHALLLGLVVTATHTSSVYLLAFVTLSLSEYILPEDLYPWLSLASGAIILVMGIALLAGRLRSSGLLAPAYERMRATFARPAVALAASEHGAMAMTMPSMHTVGASAQHGAVAHAHDHDVDDHTQDGHPHDDRAHEPDTAHSHGLGGAHSHAIPGADGEPVRWQQLVGLGVFGGMLPCPTAIVVMLSAIALHRVVFGLVLIVAFSVGLAAVLTGIGFALVYSRAIAARVPFLRTLGDRSDRAGTLAAWTLRLLPVGAAAAVCVAGVLITLHALAQQGAL